MLTASPVGVSATAVSSMGISLAWTATPGITYSINRGAYSMGESAVPLETGNTTGAFLDPNTDLVSGHDYYYTVTAVSGGVQSAASAEVFAYAPGPYIAPTVDFSNGFPASSASSFTAQNSVFNSDSTVSVGGSLKYNSPVNTKQFNIQFEIQQPVAGTTVALSLELMSSTGKTLTIFDGTQYNFTALFGARTSDEYLVQLSYSQILSQGQIYLYVSNGQNAAGNGGIYNIPVLLGSDISYPVFFANTVGQTPKLQNWFHANSFYLPLGNPTTTVSSAGIDLHFPSTYLGEDSAANFGSPIEQRIFRGTAPGQEDLGPIGVVGVGSDFLDKTAVPGVTYYYVADGGEGVGGPTIGVSGIYINDGGSGATTAEISASIPAVQQPAQLTGIPIGTAQTWDGSGTVDKVFDGNLSTFFDPANGNLTNWAGLDLGKPATITQISFAPRAGYEFRMLDGQFQVSSTPDFSSDVHTLYTITTLPTAGQLTTVAVNSGSGYRYIRYTGGLQWVNIAEMQVVGYRTTPPPSVENFFGNPIGAGGAWTPTSTVAQAFDGNILTYFDPANGNLSNWCGLDLVKPLTITQISYEPRPGYAFRMLGGQFQVSSTPDFSSDVHTLYTITQTPTAGVSTTVNFPAVGAYRYVRYTGGYQWVNIADAQFSGPVPPIQFDGAPIGVGGAWVPSSGIAAAFDGNLNTYFDPANGNLTNWVGLDLGVAKVVTQVSFAARAGYESRMIGAQIQISSTADFSSDVQTLYTITAAPVAGQLVTVTVNPNQLAYRYIRYVGGTQWVNIAELEVAG